MCSREDVLASLWVQNATKIGPKIVPSASTTSSAKSSTHLIPEIKRRLHDHTIRFSCTEIQEIHTTAAEAAKKGCGFENLGQRLYRISKIPLEAIAAHLRQYEHKAGKNPREQR